MDYTNEDYNFIKSWLNKCVTIKKGNDIYYITSDNIERQLKYNQLLKNNKNIKIDLIDINFKNNVILYQYYYPNTIEFYINYYKIWSVFESKYNYDYQKTSELINNILYNIFNFNKNTVISTNRIIAHETPNLYNTLKLKTNIIKIDSYIKNIIVK